MLIFVFSFSFLFALFSSRDQIFTLFFFSLLFFFFSIFWNIINNHILSILTLFPVSIFFSIRDRGGVELEEYTIIYGTAIFTRCLRTRGTYNKNSSMLVIYYTHSHTHTFFSLIIFRSFHTLDYLKSFLAACHTKVLMNFARNEFL